PSTAKPLADVGIASTDDLEAAVAAAKKAFPVWSKTSPVERSKVLLQAAKLLRERNDEIAKVETLDTGKAYSETSTVDVFTGADVLEPEGAERQRFFSREDRLELFRSMPGLSSMLPKGGNAVWGNGTWAPDDPRGTDSTLGNMVNFRTSNSTFTMRNLTMEDSEKFLLAHSDLWYHKQLVSSYSNGVAHTMAEVEANENDPRKWLNPLETRLPYAPDLKIFCFYGVGKPTERAYFYRDETPEFSKKANIAIDTALNSEDGLIDHGVVMNEGDGTVNLLSLGYMPVKGWKMKRYNPAGVKVTVYEMPHEPDRFSPRGGPNTGDHVDILGRSSLNDLILRIAGGQGHLIEDNYVSHIREYAENVKIYEEGI
ncbi:hypothetical protein KEM55_006642, partial [Ascosphaera atra]